MYDLKICIWYMIFSYVQEYVDHGASIYKVYAIGNKVFHAVRKSLPNSASLLALSQNSGISPITFNRYLSFFYSLFCIYYNI